MENKDMSTQEKIIIAAVECIEEEGIQSVTVRSIAKKAKVNVAAINYYFRSKDILIRKVLESRRNHSIQDMREILNDKKTDIFQRLEYVFSYLVEGAARYPRFSKALFYDSFVEDKDEGEFSHHLNNFLQDLHKDLERKPTLEKHKKLKYSLVQTFSAIFFAGLFPSFYHDYLGTDFSIERTRNDYIKHLMNHYFERQMPDVKPQT